MATNDTEPKEHELLGQLDAIFEQLDDAAKCRAMNWLRAKHIPNGNLPEATRYTFGPAMIPPGHTWPFGTEVIC
jgi:hypothetical protein